MVSTYSTLRLIAFIVTLLSSFQRSKVLKFSGSCGVDYSLPELIVRTKSFLRVRACERYLALEFGFNLNQGCSGMGTRGNDVPTLFF